MLAVDIFAIAAEAAKARAASAPAPAKPAPAKASSTASTPAHPLKTWAAKYSDRFQMAQAIQVFAPDRVRKASDAKLVIECPFEQQHSNPGEGEGTFVVNAGEGTTSTGFVVHCSHSHCKGRDRLAFVCEMVEAGWFADSVLRDPAYNIELEGDGEEEDGRVLVVVNREHHGKQLEKIETALHAANEEDPTLFLSAENPARLIKNSQGRRRIHHLGLEDARVEIARVARVERWTQSDGRREVAAPNDVVLPLLTKGRHDLPPLDAVVGTPVFGPNGTINTTPGYDRPSRLYFDPNGLVVPDVSPIPDEAEVKRAKELLLVDVLGDFPFDGPEDGAAERAHAVCMFLQPFVRPMIDGPTPIYLVLKPAPGTGAGKLINAWGLITQGVGTEAGTECCTEDEWRKRITAKLASGAASFYLDNVNRKIDSSALAGAITAPIWQDRELGFSRVIEAPVRLTWIFAGNNPTMSNEIARRCVRIRLDAKVERPELRKGFRHADLEGWVTSNRGLLIWAALTIIQNWVAQGKPKGDRALGSFEAWGGIMGGILGCAGVKGFLANDGELHRDADEEGQAVRDMLAVWWSEWTDQPATIGGTGSRMGGESLFAVLEEAEALPPLSGFGDSAKKLAFGKYVARLKDRIFTIAGDDGASFAVRVERGPDREKRASWKLSKMQS